MAEPQTLNCLPRDSDFKSSCSGQPRDLSLYLWGPNGLTRLYPGDGPRRVSLKDPKNPTFAYEAVHRKPSRWKAEPGPEGRAIAGALGGSSVPEGTLSRAWTGKGRNAG